MTSIPATAIARQAKRMNNVRISAASVEEPQANPEHVDGASAARIASSSDDVSSSMIEPTVANSDPVPSRAEVASARSALPNRSKAASYELGVTPGPSGGLPSVGAPPGAVGSSSGDGAGAVPGGEVGVGSGAGEDVGAGDGVGSGLGDGGGSDDCEGSGVGEGLGEGFGDFEGFGGFVGFGVAVVRTVPSTDGSVLAATADDTALRVKAIVTRATALAWRARLLRPLDPPAT
jgi:hypothetical protein